MHKGFCLANSRLLLPQSISSSKSEFYTVWSANFSLRRCGIGFLTHYRYEKHDDGCSTTRVCYGG